MNQLQEQLDYLNYLCEVHRAKPRHHFVLSGTPETGFGLCTCSTERFINFSSRTNRETRAALLSTWMVGYAVHTNYAIGHMKQDYSFVTVNSHGGYDYQCPSWIISPSFGAYNGEKTWFDYGLIGDYFEEAILVAKEECPEQTHRNMHWTFARSIDAMQDETAQQCLSAKLGYVFPIEQELYEDELVSRGL
jgi:hypothetical protein